MTIKVGDHLPQATFTVNTPDGPVAKTTDEMFKGKTMVLFGVPGAFTADVPQESFAGFPLRTRRISKPRGSKVFASRPSTISS